MKKAKKEMKEEAPDTDFAQEDQEAHDLAHQKGAAVDMNRPHDPEMHDAMVTMAKAHMISSSPEMMGKLKDHMGKPAPEKFTSTKQLRDHSNKLAMKGRY